MLFFNVYRFGEQVKWISDLLLTLLRRRSLFLINWFLYDCDLRHERVKTGQYQWGQGMFFLYKSLSKSTIRFFQILSISGGPNHRPLEINSENQRSFSELSPKKQNLKCKTRATKFDFRALGCNESPLLWRLQIIAL